MIPLSAAQVREAIAKLPIEFRTHVAHLAASSWDEGVSAGLARSPRNLNPFISVLPPAPEKSSKGKAR